MKRVLILLAGLLLPVAAFGQGHPFKQNVDSQVFQVEAVSSADPAVILDDVMDTGAITITIKDSARAVTTFTAGSGTTDHSCTVETNAQTFSCFLDAADVDQLGSLHITATAANMLPFQKEYTVEAVASYEANIEGNLIDQTLFTRAILVPEGVTKSIFVGPFVSSTDHITTVTTGTPACTARSNTSSTYSTTGLTEAAVDTQGASLVSIDASIIESKTNLFMVCTLANADTITLDIYVQ